MYDAPDGRRYSLVRAWNGRPVPVPALSIRLLRDGAPAPDPLQVDDLGDGWLRISYVPSRPGFDRLELEAPAYGFRASDFSGAFSIHRLDHDFRSPGRLRLVDPEARRFRLRVYRFADWASGRQQAADALAETGLDAAGRWLDPVFVAPGFYTVVAVRDSEIRLLAVCLEVGPHRGDADVAAGDSDALLLEPDTAAG